MLLQAELPPGRDLVTLTARTDRASVHTAVKACKPVQFGAFGAPAGLAGAALLLQPAPYLPACFGQPAVAEHAGPACHAL